MTANLKLSITLISLLKIALPLLVWAQQGEKWDYSLGSEYGKSSYYTPIKKIESEVLYYPYVAEGPTAGSPIGTDFYRYILPRDVFGIETVEFEFKEGESDIKDDTVDIERLVKELEEAVPLILGDALKRQEESLDEYKYGLRIKIATAQERQSSTNDDGEEKESIQREPRPEEREVDILVSIIFGQHKIIIKLPPLKDPKDKERLIKELERIAHILVRQDELVEIGQIVE
jgi:hypothetical protein